jgi:hypothetical protein
MGVRKYRGRYRVVKDWPDGKRFNRLFPNRKQAEDMLTRIEASILDGTWIEFREELKLRNRCDAKVPLKDFSETYIRDYARVRNKKKAWKRKVTSFNALNRYLGELDLKEISPARMHNYVKKRKKSGASNATINRDIAILKHLPSYAVECGVIDVNPIEKFKLLPEEIQERQRYTDEQVDSVIDTVRADCSLVYFHS